MSTWITLVKISIIRKTYYRTNLLLNLVVPITLLVGQFFLWNYLYSIENQINGIFKEEMFTYVLIAFALNNMLTWSTENSLSREIRSGQVFSRFIRPVSFFKQNISEMIGNMIIQGGFNFAIVIIILIFAKQDFYIPSIKSVFFFFPCCILGSVLRIMVVEVFSLLCFFTTSHLGITWTRKALYEFFSGTIIPLYFFTDVLKRIAYLTPFPYMIHVPISVLLDENSKIIHLFICIQLIWIVLLKIFHNILMRYVKANMIIAGG